MPVGGKTKGKRRDKGVTKSNCSLPAFGRGLGFARFEQANMPGSQMSTHTQTVGYDSKVEGEVIVTQADAVINWIRKHSVWPMPMGLACCAIELMAAGGSRFDISRFGMEVMRFSPRQADCMIVAGTVTYKMAEVVRRIYEQMAEPKWVVAMGACASTGGMYRSYATLQGVDRIIPVDVYISGCPPRPEALLDAMIKLQDKIGRERSVKDLKARKTPVPEITTGATTEA